MASPLPHAVPRALEQRLAALVPRVRAIRVARGASLCLLAAVASTTLVLLLDALLGLPATARGLLVAVWVTALGVLVWQCVVRPWQTEIPLSEVALELAERLPELADRLGAIVDPANGTSDAVRAALAEDALRRAKVVDFARAIPAHPAMLRACGAILALLAFFMLTGLVPGSAERLRRVALPWARPPAAAVRVIVTSGEPVVERGGPVTLTAFAERTDARSGGVPDRATALFRDGPNAPEEQVPMVADEAGAFHVTRANVQRDFEYRVLIGGAASGWLKVTALDPVELADGTQLKVLSPSYTKRPEREFARLTDIDAPEFSRLSARLRFTRPAAAAHFEWRAGADAKPELFPVELAPDRLSGSALVSLRASGELKLVLVREADGKKLRAESVARLRVVPDAPPRFESVSGVSSRPRAVRPGWRVPIVFVASDDFGVSTATLEYTLNAVDPRIESVPVALTGAGTVRAAGRFDLDPAALAPTGKILFRVRVTDNRAGDGPKLTPQEALYPPTGWSALTISGSAPPLEEQDVENQHENARVAIEVAQAHTRDAAEAVNAVRATLPASGPLAVDQAVRLNNARDAMRRAGERLADLARDASLTPELRPLATAAREVPERALSAAEAALVNAEGDDAGRAEALAGSARSLATTSANLGALLSRNAELRRARLDRVRLSALASAQAALAESAKTAPSEFPERQRELLARLQSLIENSEPLRLASAGASGEEAGRFARDIAELAAALRELDGASAGTVADARAALVAGVAQEQEVLTRRAARLFAAIETAARLAGVRPPRPDEFRRVTGLAAAGRTVEALTELEKQVQAVEHLATVFDAWAADRVDAKKAAKQLALWQDDLLTRFRAATKATAFDKLPDAARTALRTEQAAIRAALGRLHLPPDAAVEAARDAAGTHCGTATEFLGRDGRGADTAMRLASGHLNRLAELAPTVSERLNKATRDFDKLRQDQDALASAVEQALRNSDGSPAVPPPVAKRLASLAEQQRKLAPAVAALDLPGFGARQARLRGALERAAADLQAGAPLDVPASQAGARLAFERLKLALDGLVPADLKSEDLHRTLRTLADGLDAHGANLTAKLLEPAAPVVQDALRQLPALTPEAPALLNEARAALQTAEAGFRDGSKPDEARRRVRIAAEALGKLSARLNGSEPAVDRVKRLAGYRRAGAARAKELVMAKAPVNTSASDEALRQLGREADELAHTRVGAAAQAAKKRVTDQYARLRTKPEPDRLPSDQRALAEALDDLAAKMAGAAVPAPVPVPEASAPAETGTFLPSRAFAAQLREFAKQLHALHDRLTNFPRALADRLRPATANPFTALEARQRALSADLLALVPEAEPASRAARAAADRLRAGAVPGAKAEAERALRLARDLARAGGGKPWGPRAVELSARQGARLDDMTKLAGASNAAVLQQLTRAGQLASRAASLADALERAARLRSPQDATRAPLAGAAGPVREASKKLLEAGQKAADADAARAAAFRAEALARLHNAHTRLTGAVPAAPAPNPSLGSALCATERAMRAALDAPPRDPGAASAAAEAATALRAAAANVPLPK